MQPKQDDPRQGETKSTPLSGPLCASAGTALPKIEALPLVKRELEKIWSGETKETLDLSACLVRTEPKDLPGLIRVVDSFIERLSRLPEKKPVHDAIVYGLFNSIVRVEGSPLFKERSELLFEQLLPFALRCKDHSIKAWCHVTVAMANSVATLADEAQHHFEAAWKLIKDDRLIRCQPNALPIYQYFLVQAIKDPSLEWRSPDLIEEIRYWSRNILSVIDPPAHKAPQIAAQRPFLFALQMAGDAAAKLESLDVSVEPSSVKLFERLVMNSAFSPDPLAMPVARIKLARAYATNDRLDDGLSESVAASIELTIARGIPAADKLSAQAAELVHLITAQLEARKDDGESYDGGSPDAAPEWR